MPVTPASDARVDGELDLQRLHIEGEALELHRLVEGTLEPKVEAHVVADGDYAVVELVPAQRIVDVDLVQVPASRRQEGGLAVDDGEGAALGAQIGISGAVGEGELHLRTRRRKTQSAMREAEDTVRALGWKASCT